MPLKKLYPPLRLVSFVVLGLMLGAIFYAFAITVLHWTGINV